MHDPLPLRAVMGAQIKAVPGWGEYFSKVYLLRPKIRCNSPHSRPGRVPRRGRLYPNAMGTSTPMRWVQAPPSLVFRSHSSMHRFYLSPHSRPKGQRLAGGAASPTSSRSRKARRYAIAFMMNFSINEEGKSLYLLNSI